jgi:hypothetical protein
MSYTDTILMNDKLLASTPEPYGKMAKIVRAYIVVDRNYAYCEVTKKRFKLNRRGNDARLFVGNFKVLGRI